MIRGNDLEEKVHEPQHVQQVLAEIESNFPAYFARFAQDRPEHAFAQHLDGWEREEEAYREYLDPDMLEEYEADPNAFKSDTIRKCPIIRRCLNSPSEVMDDYRRCFYAATGRKLLDTVRSIAEFGAAYAADFDDAAHERASSPGDLCLEQLNEPALGCGGVIGYGIQSSFLYGVYPRQLAHRSQNAVWALYFLSGRKEFGLKDGSEFLMVYPKLGTCEQNYFYPAELFGFYALKLYLLLKAACARERMTLQDSYRYIYLSCFCDRVAEMHEADMTTLRQSSEHVESQPWWR